MVDLDHHDLSSLEAELGQFDIEPQIVDAVRAAYGNGMTSPKQLAAAFGFASAAIADDIVNHRGLFADDPALLGITDNFGSGQEPDYTPFAEPAQQGAGQLYCPDNDFDAEHHFHQRLAERYQGLALTRAHYDQIAEQCRTGTASIVRQSREKVVYAVEAPCHPATPLLLVWRRYAEIMATALPRDAFMLCDGKWLRHPTKDQAKKEPAASLG